MDDMTRLEQRMADDALRVVGPSRPVDVDAIFATITATRSPKWRFQTMFSATKFVVAGAIVALFGGFLLAGLLTQPSDDKAPAAVTASPTPMKTEDLLSSMVTEEVAPGVFRVLDDGAGHDLVTEPPGGVTVAPDDSVWLLRAFAPGDVYGWTTRVDALFELGEEGTHELADPYDAYAWPVELAVDTDGVAWIDAEGDLLSFDGRTFTLETRPRGVEGLARWLPDGVARLVDGEWAILAGVPHGSAGSFFEASADGSAWSAPGSVEAGQPIQRYDGQGWEAMYLPLFGELSARALATGPDGTFWVYLDREEPLGTYEPYLARFAGGNWTVFGSENGVPILNWHTYSSRMAVDGEGRVWIAPGNGDGWPADLNDELGAVDGPVGVLAFDGQRWSRFLDGVQVNRVAIADDGTVYATGLNGCTEGESFGPEGYGCPPGAMDPTVGGLYVITPEAVAVAE